METTAAVRPGREAIQRLSTRPSGHDPAGVGKHRFDVTRQNGGGLRPERRRCVQEGRRSIHGTRAGYG